MFRRSLMLAAALLVVAQTAHAQSAWEAPQFFSPTRHDEIGLYYFKTNNLYLFDKNGRQYQPTGLKLVWRESGNLDLGVQAGTADLKSIGQAILVGVELSQPLTKASTLASGLQAAWTLGGGAVFGSHYADASVPVGLSLGLKLGTGTTSIVPYIHPRASLDISSFDTGYNCAGINCQATQTGLGLAADLGADVSLGETLVARGAYTIGRSRNGVKDRDAWGFGLALRMPRKIVVR